MKVFFDNKEFWPVIKCKTQEVDGKTLQQWIIDILYSNVRIHRTPETTNMLLSKSANDKLSLIKSMNTSSTLMDIKEDMIALRYYGKRV